MEKIEKSVNDNVETLEMVINEGTSNIIQSSNETMNGLWLKNMNWNSDAECLYTNTIRTRGFEVVTNEHRKNIDKEIQLPVRGDSRSAGYDIRTPHKVTIKVGESVLIWTDVKAYMLDDEVLNIYVRSSIGTKKGLVLTNTVGIIDSSYYGNKSNDGNIGICLKNTSNKDVHLAEQERICQGVFQKYLITDNDVCLNNERTGGFGSSGTK